MRVFSLLLSALLSFANSQNFYVIPSDGSHACPPGEECHQLSYYADHSSMLLPISNLTFLNGEHILGKEVTLSGFDTLLLQGMNGEWSEGPHESTMQSSVIIRCTNDSITAFDITFTQKLVLMSLTVTGCKTAFSLSNITVLIMEKMSIQNNSFFGLNLEFYNHQNTSNAVKILESSFYQNCLHPPTANGLIKKCCHLQLLMYKISFYKSNISHSNFSFGANFYAGVCLIVPEANGTLGYLFNTVSHCLFLNNTGSRCGGLLLESFALLFSSIKINESVFLHNKLLHTRDVKGAYAGGMCIIIVLFSGSQIVISDSLFQENSEGGGLIAVDELQVNFKPLDEPSLAAFINLLAHLVDKVQVSSKPLDEPSLIAFDNLVQLVVDEVQVSSKPLNELLLTVFNSIFTKNTAAGLSIHTNANVLLSNSSILYSNHGMTEAGFPGALDLKCNNLNVNVAFDNMTISHNNMSGIIVNSCNIGVHGTSVVSNNTSNAVGGGLLLSILSYIYSAPSGRMIFQNNRAGEYGGAIYSFSKPFEFRLLNIRYCTLTEVDAIFVNNIAGRAGNDIYNGYYYHHCSLDSDAYSFNDSFYSCTNETFKVLSHIKKPISLSMSSDPLGLCLCTDAGITDCTITSVHRKVYPGSVITLSLAAVGMCGGITPGVVVTQTYGINVTLDIANVQTNAWECKKFRYLLRQVDQSIQNGYLYVSEPTGSGRSAISVSIQFLECPTGLYLDSSGSCNCNPVIGSAPNAKCNVSWPDTPVRRSGNIWLTYDTQYNCTIAKENCPFDYCNSSTLYLSLDDPDTQCMHNRSGTLCGGCQPGLSLMLGSNRCYYCNNSYLSLIIVFILAGIALVAFLLVFNTTVSVGSINGLLFYANTVKLNEVFYFPYGVNVKVLSQFIAWLNLDFGIETCFFNGLDGYWKTWLQFVFPIYIWLLIGAIIIGSYYSGRLSRVFGNNTVPVLATLILMSYSKLLHTITNVLMITNIKCGEKEWSVWSVDANIHYFSYKHLLLFGVSFLFLIVGLLYGGMVFSAQWLQKCTGRYCKSSRDPMVKLKPLVDSYTGPYKDKYRFWTGLLIFIRVLLTALFSYTTQTMPGINNYIIVAVCGLLIKVSATGVYRNTALNNLEFLHYLNVISISLLNELSHRLQWINARLYLSSSSVCISMLLFASTVLAHIYIKIEAKYGKPSCLKWRRSSINNEGNYNLLREDFYSDEVREGSPP